MKEDKDIEIKKRLVKHINHTKAAMISFIFIISMILTTYMWLCEIEVTREDIGYAYAIHLSVPINGALFSFGIFSTNILMIILGFFIYWLVKEEI